MIKMDKRIKPINNTEYKILNRRLFSLAGFDKRIAKLIRKIDELEIDKRIMKNDIRMLRTKVKNLEKERQTYIIKGKQ